MPIGNIGSDQSFNVGKINSEAKLIKDANELLSKIKMEFRLSQPDQEPSEKIQNATVFKGTTAYIPSKTMFFNKTGIKREFVFSSLEVKTLKTSDMDRLVKAEKMKLLRSAFSELTSRYTSLVLKGSSLSERLKSAERRFSEYKDDLSIREKLEKEFEDYDLNNDGKITSEEFKRRQEQKNSQE
jgi:hypothetical protein